MNSADYNKLFGKALYMEVRDTVGERGELSNLEIRNILVERHRFRGTRTQLRDLYERIARTTNQLHLDGYLDRATKLAKNRNDKYVYTLKPQPTC